MSRGRVAICALVAMFTFAAQAAPALAKKEYKREFEASGPSVKLETRSVGTEFLWVFPIEEHKAVKVKCAGVEHGPGEITTTENKTQSFKVKVTYAQCKTKGQKGGHEEVTVSPIEWEFHANGTASVLNEAKFKLFQPGICTIILTPGQTVGQEEVEEGKKGPENYRQIGKSPPEGLPEVEVKTKVRTHEEGEEDGIEFEGEGSLCETGEFKLEGGKLKGNMIVSAKAKETWIGFKEELLPPPPKM
ncbi:MAG TPA: hypothetical protein VMI13_01465 [Solirubrobacteraceae bacterium]|nr:hypothetical protein [Solirubrobacteraceae bacterium]